MTSSSTTSPAPGPGLPDSVRPLTATIGAEITGVDLATELSDATISAVRSALLRWKVLWFRDQDLDLGAQTRFAGRFGALAQGHPTLTSPEGEPGVLRLDSLDFGRADHWHTDSTFAMKPPAISVLRVVKVPEVGGDTMWATTEAAYERLPGPLQLLARELRVVHTNEYDYGRNLIADSDPLLATNRERIVPTVIPDLRTHSENSCKAQ